ncbi:hypothetical protein CMI47_20730 [Candidatus Pacearchaeota archaeon]|nr:hypothetical protein [Candidatus Pacearchaeota archaeon]|tara:strand:- start:2760 stop:3032 length:273 start_codon:yes stop_codon:yes gene_type:complete
MKITNPYLQDGKTYLKVQQISETGYQLLKPNQFYNGQQDKELWHQVGRKTTKRGLLDRMSQDSNVTFIIGDEEIRNPSALTQLLNHSQQQ